MTINRIIALCCLLYLAACDHPIAINGQGDVTSASGERDCQLEDQPCVFRIVDEYQEAYQPQPRNGFEFAGWDGCGTFDGDACVFNVPAGVVESFWGQTMPPLTARFSPQCIDGPASSFAAIQAEIFSICTTCHGASGGLNLEPAVAYDNIVNVESRQTTLNRVVPGNPDASYLYQKLFEKANPGSFAIQGEGMPRLGGPLSNEQLQALALWISAGAPETGRVGISNQVETLLGFCN